MAVEKTVSFRQPFIGATFQHLTELIQGRDGYLAGGAVTEAGGLLTVAPYSLVQRGIVAEETAATASIPVPTVPEPWFILAALPDDEPSSGIVLTATGDIQQVLAGAVVIAYKTNGSWKNPRSLSVDGVRRESAAEPGAESGFVPFPVTTGTSPAEITSVRLSRGLVVDPSGARRELADQANDPVAALQAPGVALVRDGTFPRTDYAVLRQNEDGTGSIVQVFGNAQGQGGADGEHVLDEYESAGAAVLDVTGTTPATFGRRGDKSYWTFWGTGNTLRLNGFHQTAGAIASMNVLTGSGTVVHSTAVAGENSAGSVVAVYSDRGASDVLQLVSVNPETGAVVDGPAGITTSSSAYTNTRVALGPDDVLHIVTQEELAQAPPNQKIVYIQVSVAPATFGTVIEGPTTFSSSTNDTYPSIALDRRGHRHIAYTTGSLADTFGNLRYRQFDAENNEVADEAPSVYGGNSDPRAPQGLETLSFNAVQAPSLVVTPHDEVYVFAIGRPSTGNFTEVVVYSPSFEERFAGHEFIWCSKLFGSEVGIALKNSLAAVVDDHGAFVVAVADDDDGMVFARLDTVIAPNGVVGDSYLENTPIAGSCIVDSNLTALTEIQLTPTGLGGLFWGYVEGVSSRRRLTGQRSRGRRPTPHRNDVYLAAFNSDSLITIAATDETPAEDVFRGGPLRTKGGDRTIVVGPGGDYAGSQGLVLAIEEASQTGAEIYVKGGQYLAGSPLVIPGGMKIHGEGAELYFYGRNSGGPYWLTLGFPYGGPLPCTVDASDPRIVILHSSTEGYTRYIKPGDSLYLDEPSPVMRNVVHVLDSRRVVVDGAIGTPVTNYLVYSTGIDMSGVHVNFVDQEGQNVLASYLRNSRVSGLFRNEELQLGNVGLFSVGCRECVFEDFAFGTTHATADYGMSFTAGYRNALQRCSFGSAGGSLSVSATESEPSISDCSGPSSGTVYAFGGPRSAGDFARMVNCRGDIGGLGTNEVATVIPNNIVDQTHMTLPVALADTIRTDLAPGLDSIFHGLNANTGKGGFSVSNGDKTYSSFASISDAITWLQTVGVEDGVVPEIVVTEMIPLTATEVIDLTGIGSLVIRGAGENAGFGINADTSTLRFTAPASDAEVYRFLKVENLAFYNSQAAVPSAGSSYILINDGSFNKVVVRNCRTVRDPGGNNDGAASFFIAEADVQINELIVEDNYAYSEGTTAYVAPSGLGFVASVQMRRNRFRAVPGGNSARGIDINGGSAWVIDNHIDGEYSAGILIGGDFSQSVVRGNRVELNASTHAQVNGIFINPNNCHIIDNSVTVEGDNGQGIELFTVTDAVVRGNHVVTSGDATGGNFSCAALITTNTCTRMVIASNVFEVQGDGNAGSNNAVVYLGDTVTETTVVGNVITSSDTATDKAGLWIKGDKITVVGNSIKANGAALVEACLYLDTTSDSVSVAGNTLINANSQFIAPVGTNAEFGTAGASIPGANATTTS